MPEPLYRPWGTVAPEFWAAPEPGTAPPPPGLTPDMLRAGLVKTAEIAQAGRLPDAAALAARIDRDATAEYGELHLHTIQVREVRGYLAALAGDHPSGLSWYLHSAQLRVTIQGPGHPDVEAATRRAYSLWRAVPPGPDRQRLGAALLTVATDIHGADSPLVQHIRGRLYDLAVPLPSTAITSAASSARAGGA
ncbi:hypothetical protein GCM10010348_61590 [Streptomyces anthocyanicus]|uniref:hypothetical protein n=1 Tax=Streptomyces anthocyanicus TaxID=68174 RepID=UPI001874D8DD|nr:hypothetical protein [Streptomyces anthocyanicus]GHC27322.1 hypothetical protein GCM10010348_61590 [Streptomyces anthocyanicus]